MATLDKAAQAKLLVEREAVATHIGRNFCFAALRWDAVVGKQLAPRTRELYGVLAKMYQLSSKLRSDRVLLSLKTKAEYPVDGKVSINTTIQDTGNTNTHTHIYIIYIF